MENAELATEPPVGGTWDSALNAALSLAEQGGLVIYILGILSVFGLALVLYKLAQFTILRSQLAREKRALDLWRQANPVDALKLVKGKQGPVSRLMAAAMAARINGVTDKSALEDRLEIAAVQEITDLRQFMRALELIAITSPLLGLLGTVLGMIDAFRALEAAGSRVDPSILSGGIWVALLTTAAGLIVAIPAATFHSLFEGTIEKTIARMEQALTLILLGSTSPKQ
ncbi:MAG: MotA/TolQ/ExbB proton channel family protein [Rhizobiales bacterium]|nr:MotA/TolQ/ExbB proton channel family protein [Hyphomicrobiales bacterium]